MSDLTAFDKYLDFDPFDGERDVDIKLHTALIRKANKDHPCLFGVNGWNPGDGHRILRGSYHKYEKAIVDGKWGEYRICLPCMDRLMQNYE